MAQRCLVLKEADRQIAVTELARLGFFDSYMSTKVVRDVALQGRVRAAFWQEWRNEALPLAEENGTPEWAAVTIWLLSQFDLYGLGEVVDQTKLHGAEVTHARFLESALQFKIQQGEAYDSAVRLGRGTWKGTWNMLVSHQWEPSDN